MSDITQYLPDFLLQSKTLQAIYSTGNKELTGTEDAIEDLLNQCFVDTATWGLDLWDEFLWVNTREYPTEERRNILKNRLLMQPPSTLSKLYSLLNNVADNVYIAEDYANYTFEITLLVKGKWKASLNKIMEQIEEIKPAHLDYKMVLGYLLYLAINTFFTRWLSDILKQCGTVNTSGDGITTTDGKTYKDMLKDSKKSWLSIIIPVSSEITYCGLEVFA